MQFPVYTEEQIIEMRKDFIPGICDFAVQEAKEGISKTNNPYTQLIVRVFDTNGTERTVYDFIMPTETGAFKARHFLYSVGLGKDYESGRDFAAHEFRGKQGKADVYLGKAKDKEGNDVMRLKIKDYIVEQEKSGNDDFFNDDINF